jgi:hypothetical protein
MAERFVARCQLPYSAGEVFRWHQRPGALARLNPPWEAVEILEQSGGVEDHGRVVLRVKVGPIWRRWVAQHVEFEPDRAFHDTQVQGPFAAWDHWHRFQAQGADACELEDAIDYALPGGPLGRLCGGGFVRRKLARVFRYRHTITRQDLARHHLCKERAPLNVLISGSSGLVGGALLPFLTTGGHSVRRLVRDKDLRPLCSSPGPRWISRVHHFVPLSCSRSVLRLRRDSRPLKRSDFEARLPQRLTPKIPKDGPLLSTCLASD